MGASHVPNPRDPVGRSRVAVVGRWLGVHRLRDLVGEFLLVHRLGRARTGTDSGAPARRPPPRAAWRPHACRSGSSGSPRASGRRRRSCPVRERRPAVGQDLLQPRGALRDPQEEFVERGDEEPSRVVPGGRAAGASASAICSTLRRTARANPPPAVSSFTKWPYSCASTDLSSPSVMPSRSPTPRMRQRSVRPASRRAKPPCSNTAASVPGVTKTVSTGRVAHALRRLLEGRPETRVLRHVEPEARILALRLARGWPRRSSAPPTSETSTMMRHDERELDRDLPHGGEAEPDAVASPPQRGGPPAATRGSKRRR